MDWNDLRYFLAVQRTGSLLAAARELKVDHTTVGRRLAALERALGALLFRRTPEGMTLTPAGAAILPAAEDLERAARAVEQRAGGADDRVEGTVRITTSEAFTPFLMRAIAELHGVHPALRVEVLPGNRVFDLARHEADLALRLARTEQQGLLTRKIGASAWGIYASEAYLARAGQPATAADLSRHDVVGYAAELSFVTGAEWLAAHAPDARVIMRASSILAVRAAVTAGVGIGAIPCFLAEGEAGVRRALPDCAGWRDICLVTHPDNAKVKRIRAVMDFLADLVGRQKAFFEGS